VLSCVQELLVLACAQREPHGFLRRELERTDLPLTAAERTALRAVDADGLRITRLLVQKLRLQRLLAGDAGAGARLAADPAAFLSVFTAYTAAVPATAVFPSEEAAAFRAFELGGSARPAS